MVMTLKSLHKRLPIERFFSPMIMPAMEECSPCRRWRMRERCPYRVTYPRHD
jgi:hypothetical protein